MRAIANVGKYGLHWFVVVGFLLLVLVPWHSLIDAKINLSAMMSGPSLANPLGTDNLGRDLLVRLAGAVQTAILPLWLVAGLATIFGCCLGLVCQSLQSQRVFCTMGRMINLAAMAVISVPLGVLVFLTAVYSDSMGLFPMALALGTVFTARSVLGMWSWYLRDSRLEYWNSHAALGGSLWERIRKYGIQGTWRRDLLNELVFHLQVAVSIEASLSYLGFGIQEPQPSIGNILASHFDRFLNGQFWVLGCCIAVLALASLVPRSVLILAQELRLSRPRPGGLPLQAAPKIETLNDSRAINI